MIEPHTLRSEQLGGDVAVLLFGETDERTRMEADGRWTELAEFIVRLPEAAGGKKERRSATRERRGGR